jgi:hypothetical protein
MQKGQPYFVPYASLPVVGAPGTAEWTMLAGVDLSTEGSDTNRPARIWAKAVGQPEDDAGHILGAQLGGSGLLVDGNIFPENWIVNRGLAGTFSLHKWFDSAVKKNIEAGGPACVFAQLIYPAQGLLPSFLLPLFPQNTPYRPQLQQDGTTHRGSALADWGRLISSYAGSAKIGPLNTLDNVERAITAAGPMEDPVRSKNCAPCKDGDSQ